MSGKTVWDPLRKKEVALTPEEGVRQWFIRLLNTSAMVPMHMMMSEASLMFGNKKYRADILVYGRDARPVAIVECKRPETGIGQEVLDQAIRYNMVLDVRYILITNGRHTYIGERKFRADIVVYGRNAAPVAVVECKRPDIPLDGTVMDQAVRYNMALNVKYIFITNGKSTYICRRKCGRDASGYEFTNHLPTYGEMIEPD